MDRMVKGETQRGGNIVNGIRIRLHQPDPLYFYVVDNTEIEKVNVLETLQQISKPLRIDEIVKKSRVSRTKVYQVLKALQDEKKVLKSGGRPKMYGVIK